MIDLKDILNAPFPGYVTLKGQHGEDLEVRFLRLFKANGREYIMLQPKELEEQGIAFPYRLVTGENGSISLSPPEDEQEARAAYEAYTAGLN